MIRRLVRPGLLLSHPRVAGQGAPQDCPEPSRRATGRGTGSASPAVAPCQIPGSGECPSPRPRGHRSMFVATTGIKGPGRATTAASQGEERGVHSPASLLAVRPASAHAVPTPRRTLAAFFRFVQSTAATLLAAGIALLGVCLLSAVLDAVGPDVSRADREGVLPSLSGGSPDRRAHTGTDSPGAAVTTPAVSHQRLDAVADGDPTQEKHDPATAAWPRAAAGSSTDGDPTWERN